MQVRVPLRRAIGRSRSDKEEETTRSWDEGVGETGATGSGDGGGVGAGAGGASTALLRRTYTCKGFFCKGCTEEQDGTAIGKTDSKKTVSDSAVSP